LETLLIGFGEEEGDTGIADTPHKLPIVIRVPVELNSSVKNLS